ncbi:MAG: TolC family protein [Dokdonella sp.]
MRFRSAAIAALIVCSCVVERAIADERLSLDDAFARVLEFHPDLKLFDFNRAVVATDLERAALTPPLTLTLDAENLLGSGAAAGVRGAELTVSLASAIERAGKRDARLAVASRRLDALAQTERARRLDVLAEVARRYLDVVAAGAAERIAEDDIAQRQRTVGAASRRVQAGASPASVQLAAESQLARAQLERHRVQREKITAYRRLAMLWGERDARKLADVANALATPHVIAFDEVAALLEASPELKRFAGESRLREARVQLALSARQADIGWRLGVRRLQADSDWGLVGSVSMPLGAATRAGPDIRAAEAELAALDLERESSELGLYSTLAQAHGRLAASVADANEIRDSVLPLLQQAEAAAERAYRAGALSYLEWAQLQSETTALRRQRLVAIVDAQRTIIEIQRLTGASFATAPQQERRSSR